MSDMPPGYRFYPTEEELVSFYLPTRFEGGENLRHVDRIIPVLDIYRFSPWQLPHLAGDICRADPEQWFFFVPRQPREAQGGRPNRQTESGYWKATGSPGFVYSSANNRIIGEKKTMVYYVGRAPNGRKTEWKMNEYRAAAIDGEAANSPDHGANLTLRQEFSVCRVYKKSKTVRAFDRRPPAAAGIIIGDGGQAAEQHRPNQPDGNEQVAAGQRAAEDGVQADIGHQIAGGSTINLSSPEGSSHSGDDDGGGNHNLSHHFGEDSDNMAIDYESFWEWEDNLQFF